MRTHPWPLIAAVFALGAISVFFNFYFPTPAGIDNLYHIRHAWLYRTQNIFNSDFPWLQYSLIGRLNSDIWYGFHILLTPFTYFNDLVTGLRVAGALITLAALASFYLVFKGLRIVWPFFWTLLFFFSAPDVNFRLLMVRPHVLTLVLTVWLFYALVKNKPTKSIVIISAAISFLHLAMAWLPLLVGLIAAIAKKLDGETFKTKPVLAVLAGVAAGWATRPNFLSAIKLAYAQVVQLAIEKFNGSPLRFGVELRPGNRISVVLHEILPVGLLLILAAAGLVFIIRKRPFYRPSSQQLTAVYGALATALIFGALTYGVARRAADIWVAFSLIATGLVFSILYQKHALWHTKFKRLTALGLTAALVAMSVNTLKFSLGYFRDAPPLGAFRDSALWLKENSQEKDIVFNVHWDNFPMLFFWNQKNYYINGMDPIFEYAFDKGLYLKHYFVDIDKILMVDGEIYTCGTNPCGPGAVKSVYDTLKDDFKAKYVFVEMPRNPRLYKYMDSDRRFQKVWDNSREVIFQVL